jgi:hypothetical protein
MHELMTGMFWGGVVMALPPVTLGVGIAVFLVRRRSRVARRRRDDRAAGSSVAQAAGLTHEGGHPLREQNE